MTISTQDYARLSSAVYGGLSLGKIISGYNSRYEVIYLSNMSADGYQGAVFKNIDTNEIVLSNPGTDFGDIHDVLAVSAMANGEAPPQWNEANSAMRWALEYADQNGISRADVSATGHSMGGTVAQMLAAAYGVHAETFDAFGAYGIAERYGLNPEAAMDLVTNHRDAFDPVSQLSRQIGRDLMYLSDAEASAYSDYGVEGAWEKLLAAYSAHALGNFWNDKDGAPGTLLTGNRWGDVASGDLPSALEHLASDFAEQIARLKSDVSFAFDSFIEQLELAANAIIFGNTYRIVRYDPLALDLDGDGKVGTLAESNWSGALFDHDGDGIRTASGWVDGSDGLLVRDINGNGTIDNGGELFGDQTLLRNGQRAANGFEALADLDSNGDGLIDANDAAFASLRIWRDLNGDGISQANELSTLNELGIESLSLVYANTNTSVDGGALVGIGSYTRRNEDGTLTTHVMQDFDLDNDALHSKFGDQIDIPEELQSLINMQGMGALRDLREACALSSGLAQLVRDFSIAQTREGQQTLLGDILLAWAETSPLWSDQGITLHASGATENADSDNVIRLTPNQTLDQTITVLDADTARKIRIVQILLGEVPAADLWWGQDNVAAYLKVYDTFFNGSYQQLALQTRLKPYVDGIGLTFGANGIGLDFTPMIGLLSQASQVDSVHAAADFIELIQFMPAFASNKAVYLPALASVLDQASQAGGSEALIALFSKTSLLGDLNLVFGPNGGVVNGSAKDDVLVGDAGTDTLNGGAGDDVLVGGAGNDVLDGGNGSNRLLGGSGDDTLKVATNATNNVFIGGTGDDVLYGSYYSDTYVFNLGDGRDTIVETGSYNGVIDVLAFGEGIQASDITMTKRGADLVFVHANGQDEVAVKDWFSSTASSGYENSTHLIEQVTFADGMVWALEDMRQRGY
ncbi:calcium-binding protein, partial [Dyella sp. EPa41]|uniref:calcium-binding protein n=1 Tax=Dyella sp. EPa41 TaxID=1561194 RepID=UPI002714C308